MVNVLMENAIVRSLFKFLSLVDFKESFVKHKLAIINVLMLEFVLKESVFAMKDF
jgi:hypothetical protein